MTRNSPSRAPSPAMLALGAVAFGALAVGVVAVAYLAIGRLSVRRAHFRKLTIDELTIYRLREPQPVAYHAKEEIDDHWAQGEETPG